MDTFSSIQSKLTRYGRIQKIIDNDLKRTKRKSHQEIGLTIIFELLLDHDYDRANWLNHCLLSAEYLKFNEHLILDKLIEEERSFKNA